MLRELEPGKFSGELIRSETAEKFYCKLLGLDELPRSPEVLPPQVVVPRLALGNLERAILNTKRDDRERAQLTCWDVEQKYVTTEVARGNLNLIFRSVSPPKSPLPLLSGLVDFHTHPSTGEKKGPKFSGWDIWRSKLLSGHRAFIFMVGSDYGVTALFHTTQTYISTIPSLLWEGLVTPAVLLSRAYEIEMDEWKIAKIIEDEGFGYYTWRPARGVRRNNLEQGLVLDRFLAR